MTRQRSHRLDVIAAICFEIGVMSVVGAVGGCVSTGSGAEALPPPRSAVPAARLTAAPRSLALINGQPVSLEQLAPALLEAAGGVALNEIILDRMLRDEARRRGATLTDGDLERERALFVESLPDTGAAPGTTDAESLLQEIRRRRGLGPARFAAMIHRSALLRKMVEPEVVVTEEMIALQYNIEHGEQRDGRLITLAALDDAQEALAAIKAGMTFAEAAARFSTDASAERGGLIEPISPVDTAYPDSIRSALASLKPGQISPPVAIDSGYAILLLQRVTPPDGALLEEVRPELARRVRLRQTRLKMSQLADTIARRANVTVLDPSLRFSRTPR